jgi:hypothetical protein
VRADGRCALVQALARSGRVLPPVAAAHLGRCEPCREVAGQYRWLAAELRALAPTTVPDDPALVSSIGRRLDAERRRLRRVRALATVAGGLAVAGAAGVATTVARRDRVLVAALRG